MEERGKSKKFGFHLQKLERYTLLLAAAVSVMMQLDLMELYALKKIVFWPPEQSEIENCHQ